MSEELREIEREIRSWTERPPVRSPRVARTRVLARIEERRGWSPWRPAATAATLVAGLVFGLLLLTPEELSEPPVVARAEEPSPGLLVYELSSGTKLYLALAATPAEALIHPAETNREGNG